MVDFVPLESAILYYSPSGAGIWQSVAMADTDSDGVLEGVIPSTSVTEAGIDYYILGSDGSATVTSNTFTLSLNTAPPTTTIDSLTNNLTDQTSPTLTGTADGAFDIVRVQYQFDGTSGTWKNTTITDDADPKSVSWSLTADSTLTAGSHDLYIRAVDKAQKVSSPTSYTFTVQVQTFVTGDGIIDTDTTWEISGSPYTVMTNLLRWRME